MSFTTTVKKVIESSFPNHTLLYNRKGPGPDLFFQIKNVTHEHIIEYLHIYKSNWGQSFYIHIGVYVKTPIKGGNIEDTLICQDIRLNDKLFDGKSKANFEYLNDEQLREKIEQHKTKVLEFEKKYFNDYSQYYKPAITLLSTILNSYKNWHSVKDTFKYNANIIKKFESDFIGAGLQESALHDERLNMAGYHQFLCYLIMTKRTTKMLLSNIDLWHFWTNGRPFKKEDFVKKEYYDCYVCNGFKSQGELINKQDPIFGEYYEFVCKKCATKKS